MKNKRYLLTTLLLSAFLSVTADDGQPFVLNHGDVTMTIDATRGGKILSFRYQDHEMLSQSRWPESFGSTFWTSPQKEWNWPPVPEYDKNAYQVVEQDQHHLYIRSQVSDRLGFSIGKHFSVDASDGAFVVTYSIKNESQSQRKVAPWEITRVTNGQGQIFFQAVADSIWPAGLMSFEARQGTLWYSTDETPANRKVNADGRGWLAYHADGMLMLKRFQDLEASEPAPGEAEVQVYVNRGKTYIELESQGAYTLLQPAAELTWTVRWYLVPVGETAQPSQLLQTVQSILKP
ncbi:MAG: hypothetical protein K5683_07365 [Prevotella sp.]|nr:hypothetical protein [Prevotella sp.]